MGNLLAIIVHAANRHDTKPGVDVLAKAVDSYPSIEAFSGDASYKGTAVNYTKDILDRPLHISEKITDAWAVLPMRWVVESAFSWLNNFRRLSKDYEILVGTAENIIRIAMLKITLAKCF